MVWAGPERRLEKQRFAGSEISVKKLLLDIGNHFEYSESE
jgi:hypothetical protein